MAKKPEQGKAMVKWEEEFANMAKESTAGIEVSAGKFISLRAGQMSYAGADITGNELTAVVVGGVYENRFFNVEYDSDNPASPVCYAFGLHRDEMEPHEKAEDKQNDACKTCEHNQWGSAEKGEGKACANSFRLALISSDDLKNLTAAEVIYLKLPVTSVKNWEVYAKKKLADTLHRPYWSVLTKISVVPDKNSQFKVQFEMEEQIDDSKLFQPLKELYEKVMDDIDFPYMANSAKEAKSAKPVAKKRKF